MPVLSMFYGIIIRMQSEKGGKHHLPHIHVICGDDESIFSLEGEVDMIFNIREKCDTLD